MHFRIAIEFRFWRWRLRLELSRHLPRQPEGGSSARAAHHPEGRSAVDALQGF